MEPLPLAGKEKMMSSSDQVNEQKAHHEWKPLVPSDLEKYDREVIQGPDLEDPEILKAFKALYERGDDEVSKSFTLLYGPRKEFEREDQEKKAREKAELESVGAQAQEVVDTGPDLEAIKEAAHAEAFEMGHKEGYQAGLEKAREKTEHLLAIVSSVDDMWNTMVKRYETEIIELICKVAEKVVYGQVAVDKEIITRAILSAFKKIADPVHATITVHPEDYEYIEAVKEDFFEEIKGLKQVTLVSDSLIDVGGCRIETPAGEVETDIEERLEAVKQCIIENSR